MVKKYKDNYIIILKRFEIKIKKNCARTGHMLLQLFRKIN